MVVVSYIRVPSPGLPHRLIGCVDARARGTVLDPLTCQPSGRHV